MKIRLAQIDDLPEIKRCINDAFSIYVECMGKKPQPMVDDYSSHIFNKNTYVITPDDNSVSGFMVIFPRVNHLYLDTIAVNPDQQGKGLGKELIRFAEKIATNMRLYELRLCTNVHMHENQRFYPKIGFIEIERKIVDGYDRIYYRKYLIT